MNVEGMACPCIFYYLVFRSTCYSTALHRGTANDSLLAHRPLFADCVTIDAGTGGEQSTWNFGGEDMGVQNV